MRLTLQLTVAIACLVALTLLGLGTVGLRRDLRLLEHDAEAEAVAVARSLGALLEQAPGDAETAVERILPLPDLDGTRLAVTWMPAEDLAATVADADTDADIVVFTETTEAGRAVHAVHPVLSDGQVRGAVHVRKPLTAIEIYARRAFVREGVTILLISAGIFALSVVLGRFLVARRIDRLIRKARRVARGDFRHPVRVGLADELTDLADELNDMAVMLERAQADAETAARAAIAAEAQLRHADRLRTVGELAAGLAHELGTPLNVVAGRAALLERRLATDDDGARAARTIRDQTRRITELVRRMLDFSRRSEPSMRPTDLGRTVAEVASLLDATARRTGVAIAVEAPEEPVVARADPNQLQQVLSNVVMNAVQASPEDATVTVAVGPCGCERLAAPHVAIQVRDMGTGFTEAALERACDPFFTTKEPGHGTGLGLSIAFAIVQEHNGTLIIDNHADGGAIVGIHLPGGSGP